MRQKASCGKDSPSRWKDPTEIKSSLSPPLYISWPHEGRRPAGTRLELRKTVLGLTCVWLRVRPPSCSYWVEGAFSLGP